MNHTSSSAGGPVQAAQPRWGESLVGLGIVLVGLGMAWGGRDIASSAGYGGVGPNFLPLLVAAMLVLCGLVISWQACTGTGVQPEGASADTPHAPCWLGFAWLSAGVLLNAALIEHIGFALGCALCYLLAVRGLRLSQGQTGAMRARAWLSDALVGLAISLPVYWFFTQFLAIGLPGLTESGWL